MPTSSDLPEVNLQKSLDHITSLMSWFVEKIRNDIAMGLFDKNRLCEDILVPILSQVYGYTHLENLNKDGNENFPGIDLGDAIAKVAFQITSETDSAKIADTLQKFVKYEHYKRFDHLIVYIITQKQGSYAGTGWKTIIGGRFKFEKNKDIRDRLDLSKIIRHLTPFEKVQRIESTLEEYFEKREKALTADQLRSIANQSLDQHRERFAFNEINKLKQEILRDIHPTILDALTHSSKPVIGVSGPSGIGKSTLLRQIGRDINDNNRGFALWIPAESVTSVTSVDELFQNALHKHNPDLSNHANTQALELVSQTNIGLVLLVDDINRASNPDEILTTLNALSANAASKDVAIHFVVPLWLGQIAITPDERTTQKHWEIINLGYFSEGESRTYSELVLPAEISQIQQVISSLGGDPFLVGLATEDIAIHSTETIELLRQIFDRAISKSIKDARAKSNQRATHQEFDAAIDSLIGLMLRNGTPEPTWEIAREVLGIPKSDLLYDLAKINQLGWIDTLKSGDEVWRWKHTRLRDMLMGRWLARNILQSINSNSISKDAEALFDDPGLAEAFALAFAFLPVNAHHNVLAVICKYQLLSLVEILRLNFFPHESELSTIVTQTLRQAIISIDEKLRIFVGSPEHTILYNLTHITNPAVLDATDRLPGGWSSGIARLRNGDLQAGIPAILRDADSSEILMLNFPFLDQAVADFGRVRSNQKQETVSELSTELLDPKHTIAVLYIGSILKWPELIEPLWDNWINLDQETKLQSLATMVWFLSGYEDLTIIPKLEAALLMSLEIKNVREPEQLPSQREESFVIPLRLALSRPISDLAAKLWAKTIPANKGLCESMGYLLGGIDHPETLDAYVHYGRMPFHSFWNETSETIDPMAEGLSNHIKNEETRNRLWDIVCQENDLSIRRAAFGFWSKAANPLDIPKIKSVLPEDTLFENTLRLRLRLRDKTASTLLIDRISKDPSTWCRFAPLLPYEPGVFEAVLNNLAMVYPEHSFYETRSIFYRLPHEQVKRIILDKEKLLLDFPETWSALWLSGEENALGFIVKALKQSKGDEKVTSHIKYFFSRFGNGRPINQRMMNALLPVLDCFSQESLKSLAELALRNGFWKWAVENLGDVLKSVEWRAFKWVYVENIIATLAEAAEYVDDGLDSVHKKSDLFSFEHSFRDRDKYGYVASPVDAVKIWLKDSPVSANLIISSRIMSEFGTNDDIDWWLTQKPSDEKAFTIWSNALYHLRRRRWQSI